MFSESKLSIKDLVVSGVHGSTGREPHDKQRFRVTMDIDVDADMPAWSDSINDAFDYKIATAIAKHVIASERYVLLEKIVGRIVKRICQYSHVQSATVTVEKLDASQQGIPSFTGSMKRAPQEQFESLLHFDVLRILGKLDSEGAVSFPILSDSYRKALLEEAEMYEYKKQDEIVGPAKVREQLSSVHKLFSGSLFYRLGQDFERIISRAAIRSDTFATPLNLNEYVLQCYEKDSIGITPHLDFAQNVNMICIFILTGKARFALCDDRQKTNARDLDTTPGNVILMRGPGFMGSSFRPFHFVSDITERRVVCAIRQTDRKA